MRECQAECHVRVFDAHLHIIDPAFPLVPNEGFKPAPFTVADYLTQVRSLNVVGGAVVSGSFQAFDQTYLMSAIQTLGPTFVGVTQLPASVTDEELRQLNARGVRGVRFNLKRGGSEKVDRLRSFAARVYEVVGWHVELYVDARELDELAPTLLSLPAVSIDHLGLSKAGLSTLRRLVERGVHVKATGFGRVDFDVAEAVALLHTANPDALMFGTDLPSTRAPRPFDIDDFHLMQDVLDAPALDAVLYGNAIRFYRQTETHFL